MLLILSTHLIFTDFCLKLYWENVKVHSGKSYDYGCQEISGIGERAVTSTVCAIMDYIH